ncbi:unnamed protein product [Adineta ricciae]|uniref:CUB domain-containing protein n=1 Tax=Adineta ricciae TaxID=249248 RepID=A0A813ZSD5_ADIRI|nr:unnamed protein product [Adineta ricciae]CAF1059659.1 unnamed protein product [Adineta ricciae]
MLPLSRLLLYLFLPSIFAKVTYFNLENTYGPYCNPRNKFTPDAGIVRYAGTPWIGRCVLNIESCCLPEFPNGTLIPNVSISTRFYMHLLVPPLCLTENVTVIAGTEETIHINCNTPNGSEYYFDTERLTILYHRSEKLPLSKFSMIVTPLKLKTRMYTACGFDCFSDTHCIEQSLVCDRYRNCPNGVDEANCEYSHHHEPLSFRGKIILFFILMIIMSVAVSIIFGCYFCCKVNKNNNRLSFITRDRKSIAGADFEEIRAVHSPLIPSTTLEKV